MNKVFIIGLPRTGTTSVSVALLGHGFKVAHTAFTKRAFELADVISDAPCFCDYQQLDTLFPDSKFVYLNRLANQWIPSMQMLLKKMIPQLHLESGYLHPILKRSFDTTFALSTTKDPFTIEHLDNCYLNHRREVFTYFSNRNDFIEIDVSQNGSLTTLLKFLGMPAEGADSFPWLNIGKQVDSWKEFKHPNKVNPLAAGKEHRKFFNYV
jgi:hypothetical protein